MMDKTNKVKEFAYAGKICFGKALEYQDGTLAIQIFEKKTLEPIATASVNLGVNLEEGLVFIKDYNENEGVLDALLSAGIVEEVITMVPSGFVQIPLCRINTELLEH